MDIKNGANSLLKLLKKDIHKQLSIELLMKHLIF